MVFALLDEETVLELHADQLANFGGSPGVRDRGLLESAIARAENLIVYGDEDLQAWQIAASLAYGLAKNRPFIDGNKRTSLAVALVFLAANGFAVSSSDDEMIAVWLSLASGEISEAELGLWLREHVVPAAHQTS